MTANVTIAPDTCPECGFVVECCWDALRNSASPQPGDWTICANCAAPLRFTDDLRMRSTTIAERSGPGAPADLMVVVKAVATIGPPRSSPVDKAKLLIESVTAALANGVVHRNRSGRELTTPKDILECLLTEGGVECEETNDRT